MKKQLLMALVLVMAGTLAFGQTKKVTIKTPTVQCGSCKKRIEDYLSREEGVQSVNVDVKKKVAKVSFAADRTNVENIKVAIANAGYDADDLSATKDSYDRLPKCCKKPDDQ